MKRSASQYNHTYNTNNNYLKNTPNDANMSL